MKKPVAKRASPPQAPHHQHANQDNQRIAMKVSVEQSSWSGPLPAPSDMMKYDQIVSNGAERIFTAWEEESKHRRELEKKELRWTIFESIYGKSLAIIFVLSVLAVTAYAISMNANWIAAILGGTMIGSIVWAFVKVNRPNKN
ncbi:DUF2335 domain-containing protein [Ochrobactrum pseudogrignonense]|uniref:DUF2335 domain-containing protein n=1 Tax=Brucella pseudogrignonensis TaxID=419475 RepID=A0A7Y3T7C9_9HYPH|nr:DUF2335 domain-containing protein [Brucella pseudogrignonensis]NNV20567.1 DUF2335 domain-containing protein [Brucella pseudogrignonensis]